MLGMVGGLRAIIKVEGPRQLPSVPIVKTTTAYKTSIIHGVVNFKYNGLILTPESMLLPNL